MYIHRIMKKVQVVIAPESTVAEARSLLLRSGVRHVPVVDEQGALVGMLSDRDLDAPPSTTTSDGQGSSARQAAVSEVMARAPLTAAPEAEPEEALDLMLEYGIGALPVVSGQGWLLGILSYDDLLSTMAMRRA
jgi:acetoin utilization protein AcuB